MGFEIRKTGIPIIDELQRLGVACWIITFVILAVAFLFAAIVPDPDARQQREEVNIVDDLTPAEQRRLRKIGRAKGRVLIDEMKRIELGE